MAWRKAIETKKQDLWSNVPPEWKIETLPSSTEQPQVHALVRDMTSHAEQQITEQSTADVLEALRCGDVSAQEVVTAFAHRAILAHQYVRSSQRSTIDVDEKFHRCPRYTPVPALYSYLM